MAELGDFANTLEEVSQNVHANLDEAASSRVVKGSVWWSAGETPGPVRGKSELYPADPQLKDMTKKAYWAVQKRQIDLQKQSDHRAQLESTWCSSRTRQASAM